MVVQCHLPTDINNIRSAATTNMVTTNLYFTQLLMGHLKHDWYCFHVKALNSVIYLLMNFFKHLSFHMKDTNLPVHLLPLIFSKLMCSLTTMHHTQKCGNFEKTMRMTSSHVKSLCFRTCLVTMSMFVLGDDKMWPSLKCRFNTKIKIIHLCWNKQTVYSIIIYCISSLLSQFSTILLW